MRAFIDAERVGTTNQFYDKFRIRLKILKLVNDIYKKDRSKLIESILKYANLNFEDTIKMLYYLINDAFYLDDEVIQNLKYIKILQELKNNTKLWNSKTYEERK